jgi:photosystem II stability/assembly factor-like uncharacterized protein
MMKPLTLLFPLLCATVSAQWELITPIKTRSEFPDLQMVNDVVGYAIDRPMGAILRTDDGGSHWTRLANNISSQPRAIFMWDEFRGMVVAGNGTVIRTADGFITSSTSLNPTFGNIACVFFLNDTLGWIGTESGKIYRSTDAGVTWALMASGQPTSNYITAIQFVDAGIGYASCYAGEMLKSIDGGLTWQGVGPFNQVVLIQDIHFFDADIGVGVGNAGEVIRTTDGGVTWDSIPTNTTYSMVDLDVQGNTMVACGAFGRLIRSTDAGLTWTVIQAGNTDHQSIALTSSGKALLGTNGRIHGSLDMGTTWNVLVEGTWHTRINKMSFMDADTGVAIGWLTTGGFENGLLRTTDGGRHWSKAGGGGLGVHLTPEGFGCLGGGNGAFARTINGFATRIGATGPNVAIRCTWSFDANTHIVAGGAVFGGIYRTTNGGQNWTQVLNAGNITISDLWFVNDLQGYAVGEYGDNYRTVDGGITWASLPLLSGSHTVFFLNEQLGWTKNYRTVDGGENWTYMGGTPQGTVSIFFTDADTGYAVSSSAQTVRSVDGGITWENYLPEILNATVGDAAWVNGAIVIGCNNGDIFRATVSCPQVPHVPVIEQAGQYLCTNTAGTAQWFLNGEPLADGVSVCIAATEPGNYHVVVTEGPGCASSPSATVQVIATGADPARNASVMKLYPNPAHQRIQLERPSGVAAVVAFWDAQGRLVLQRTLVGMSNVLDVTALDAGVYMLHVEDANGTQVLRLVKE